MPPIAPDLSVEHAFAPGSWFGTISGQAVIWGLAVAAVGGLTWVLAVIRRRLIRGDYRAPEGLTVEQLDALRREGAITEEEYRRLRRVVMGVPPADADGAHGGDAPGAGA